MLNNKTALFGLLFAAIGTDGDTGAQAFQDD